MPFEPDKIHTGRFVPDKPMALAPTPYEEPYPMSDIAGAGAFPAGNVPTAREMKPYIRGAAQIAVGMPSVLAHPLAGAAAIGLAGAGVDLLYGDKPEVAQVGGDVLGSAAFPYALKGAGAIAKKLIPAPVEQRISSAIRYGFEKGLRPAVSGKQNFAQTQDYYAKAESAVKSIVQNKSNLIYADASQGLPKNLNQFSEAIDQTKRTIFKQYDDILQSSQLRGRGVVLDDIGQELGAISSNRVNQLAGGTGLKQAAEKSVEYKGELTLTEAQDLIAKLNVRQKAFLRNPTPDQASGAAVDAFILNRLRAKVDSAVEQYGYAGLKRQYGALRHIEKEVSHRAMVDARKNVKGLLDFSDIYTTTEMLRAAATLDPASGVFAVTMRGIKEYYKRLNDPNRIIMKMFSDVDSMVGSTVPKAMKALPPGPRPMGSGIPDQSGITVTTGEPFKAKDVIQEPPAGLLGTMANTKARSKTTSKALLGRPVYLNDKEWDMIRPFENGLGPFFTRDPKAIRWDVRLRELADEGKVQNTDTIDDLLEYLQRHKNNMWNKNKF